MYTGITGALKIGERKQRVAYISGWNVEDMSEIIEVTKIGKAHKEAYVGHQSWNASADGAIVFEGNNSQAELFEAKHKGDKIEMTFQLKDGVFLKGQCYIESLGIGLTAEGHGTISISVKGCGMLTVCANGRNIKSPPLPPSGNLYWGINRRGDTSRLWGDISSENPIAWEVS